jgi:sulfur carrier protein
MEMISITINGERKSLQRAISVGELVETLALNGKRFAVERNGSVVPRGRFAEEMLAQGDVVEVVVAVGGG